MAQLIFTRVVWLFSAKCRLSLPAFVCALVLSLLISAPTRAETAREHTAAFQNGLISVMKDAENLSIQQRYSRLQPLVSTAFNLPLMAALSAGTSWKAANFSQRERHVDAFTQMSIATLATLMNGYTGESFTRNGEKAGPKGITFVTSTLTSPRRPSGMQIAYVARKSGGTWRLIDVIVDGGISEMKVRISEYNRTLKAGGIDALSALLEGKSKQLLAP